MSSLMWDDEKSGRLDLRILQNGAISLYYRETILAADVAWFREHEYVVHTFASRDWLIVDDLHTDVSVSLGFPDWYGRNLHAFSDSLSDIDVPADGGVVLVFTGYDVFTVRHPEVAQIVLDI